MADGATARVTKTDTVVEFDVALMERARKGDSRAFERLYRDHLGRVHGDQMPEYGCVYGGVSPNGDERVGSGSARM